jgi:hypothetical protein
MTHRWSRLAVQWWPDALVVFGAVLFLWTFRLAVICVAIGTLGLFHRLMRRRSIEDRLERIDGAIPSFDINGDMIR